MLYNLFIKTSLITIAIITLPVKCQDCKSICKDNSKCLTACERPLDPKITSDLSLQHCGITSFKDGQDISSRILNGEEATNRQYPWTVSLYEDNPDEILQKRHFCVGALIKPQWVLTAGHCFRNELLPKIEKREREEKPPCKFYFFIGSDDLTESNQQDKLYGVDINNVWYPDDFQYFSGAMYDIALFKLNRTVEMKIDQDKFLVNTICLPQSKAEPNDEHPWLAGWGAYTGDKKYPTKLLHGHYALQSLEHCAKMMNETRDKYDPNDETEVTPLTKGDLQFLQWQIEYHNNSINICAIASIPPGSLTVYRSNNPFFGDSGASLTQYYNNRGHSIGLYSIGYVSQNVPASYYTKVSLFIDWIKQIISENS